MKIKLSKKDILSIIEDSKNPDVQDKLTLALCNAAKNKAEKPVLDVKYNDSNTIAKITVNGMQFGGDEEFFEALLEKRSIDIPGITIEYGNKSVIIHGNSIKYKALEKIYHTLESLKSSAAY